MDITELAEHRNQLFEVIDTKMGNMYHKTRSRKNTEEIREYVLVLLFLCREYFESHRDHFLLKRNYPKNSFFGYPIDSFIESTSLKILFPRDNPDKPLIMRDIYMIRQHFAWLFRKILEIHALLEKKDPEEEIEKRYIWFSGKQFLRPRSR